jgi:hypothetical protein
MLATQSDVLDVPVSLSTILAIREGNSYQRSLFLRNLSSSTLGVQIETSNDGGTTWAVVGTAFSLAAGELIVKEVAASVTGILRIRASGGGDDRDLEVAYARIFNDTGHTWVAPVL